MSAMVWDTQMAVASKSGLFKLLLYILLHILHNVLQFVFEKSLTPLSLIPV